MTLDAVLPPVAAASSARTQGAPGPADAGAPTFADALSAAAPRDADRPPPGSRPSDQKPAGPRGRGPDGADPRDGGGEAAPQDRSPPAADERVRTGGARDESPAHVAAHGRARALAQAQAQAQARARAQAAGRSARGVDEGANGGGEPTPDAGLRSEAGPRDASPHGPDAPSRRTARDGAEDAVARTGSTAPDPDRVVAEHLPGGTDERRHATDDRLAGTGAPTDRAIGIDAGRSPSGGGHAAVDPDLGEAVPRDGPQTGVATARGSAHGTGHAGARAGNARPAGPHGAGRDVAAGPEEAAPASAGAGIADAVRAIGERLRSATPERTAETASGSPAAPPAGMAAPSVAPHGEPPPAAEAAPPSFPVTVPVHDPRFADAFGERITWLLREGLQVAELTLHPQELGPIRIELALEGDAATIGVVAAQAETRGAIEQSLPRLRELLAQQGVHLGGTTVDSGAQRQAGGDSRSPARRGEARGAQITPIGPGAIDLTGAAAPAVRAGRVDVFA